MPSVSEPPFNRTARNETEPMVVVIAGTHSSGKTTLLQDFEIGKLSELSLGEEIEYPDFGYGIIEASDGTQHATITVPEAATQLTRQLQRPDLLTDNYSIDFQFNVDFDAASRIHEAIFAMSALKKHLLGAGHMTSPSTVGRDLVISDRSPFEGVIYGYIRTGVTDVDTFAHKKGTRVGFWANWVHSFVDAVILTSHDEVDFESSPVRPNDPAMRENVAKSIAANYHAIMPDGTVTVITGNETERLAKSTKFILSLINMSSQKPNQLPFSAWNEAVLV